MGFSLTSYHNLRRIVVILFTGALALAASSFSIAILGYILEPDLSDLLTDKAIISNIGLFLFINVSITLVSLFAYLVVKNLIKLVLDRKRRISGSGLRCRLVTIFIGLAIVPTALLFFISKAILSAVQDGWLAPQISATISGSLNVATAYYESLENQLYLQTDRLRTDSKAIYPLLGAVLGENSSIQQGYSTEQKSLSRTGKNNTAELSTASPNAFSQLLSDFLRQKRDEYSLFDISIFDTVGNRIATSPPQNWEKDIESVLPPDLAALNKAFSGEVLVQPEHTSSSEYLRAYAPIPPFDKGGLGPQTYSTDSNTVFAEPAASSTQEASSATVNPDIPGNIPQLSRYAFVLTYSIPPSISKLLSEILDANADHQSMLIYHRPLSSSYILTLMVVTVIITFAVIWVGFHMAESLSVPIQLLAEGTQEIAKGNLDHRIPDVGDDELRVLVQSFNLMTRDLKKTTTEVVARRRHMETILHNVAIGVISIDNDQRIETLNQSAATILRIPPPEQGRRLYQILQKDLYDVVLTEIVELEQRKAENTSATISLIMAGESKHLQVIVSRLRGDTVNALGYVILIDDLTKLVNAQKLAAWRDVAQRIAHEIKNPLTPIQLSAQRMLKRLSSIKDTSCAEILVKEREIVAEGTSTILSQVDILKRLVNEFSQFSRMPSAVLLIRDLNEIITEVLSMYRGLHPAASFIMELAENIPHLHLDKVQINQLLVNLLDNSLAAIGPSSTGQIKVITTIDSERQIVSLIIEDNGPGIPDHHKPKLFEPYFSTKENGTGLGLAIVSNIARDHGANIRVLDNSPCGAIFCIDFPVVYSETTHE